MRRAVRRLTCVLVPEVLLTAEFGQLARGHRRRAWMPIVALLLIMWAAPSSSTVTYEYKGNPFTTFLPLGPSNPYTTTDFVSGSFTVASALDSNLSNVIVTPISYSFTDGHQTFATTNFSSSFPISTNASGAIAEWDIELGFALPGGGARAIGTCGGASSTCRSIGDSANFGLAEAGNPHPGTWSIVPEPSALALSALPLVIIGATVGRRRSGD